MRSYLSLIPISAKVHKRQNRMTILCIVFSVFMVTAVFSLAEAGARMELARLVEKHGELSIRNLFASTSGQIILSTAGFLFLLILIAGVLMISSSMNSSVAQRTKFFGMMRCIGMSKQQIVRFVRLEALNWCKTAIPIGVAFGIIITWALCAILRFVVKEEFSNITVFGISWLGIGCGIFVGIVTVLLASRAPAKRAAKVSPITAASGNSDTVKAPHHGAGTRVFKIETALGIQHAVSEKKNLVLMMSSFALSIILFLTFSVLVSLVNYLMPQSVAAPDLTIASADGANSIHPTLLETLRTMDGVQQVYGRRSCFEVHAQVGNSLTDVDIISYDDFDLQCLGKDHALKSGSNLSNVYGVSSYVLATWNSDSTWKIGDTVQIGDLTYEITGLLKNDPFNENGLTNGKMTLITSRETFTQITGVSDYSLVMVQVANDVTNEQMEAIRHAVGSQYTFTDLREQDTSGTYFAFIFCGYGFLGIIALVTLMNIMNSISMSVSARMKQYGTMRAVGMDSSQIVKMVLTEAFSYAFCGFVAGCVIGLPLNKMLFTSLIVDHFPYAIWELPWALLFILFVFILFATFVAAYSPAKRIQNLSITETISTL